MDFLQALLILVFVVLIVWWALRRSASESAKEAPKGHEGEAHAEPLHSEIIADVEPVSASPVVVTEPEPAPEPEPEPEPVVVTERAAELIPVAAPEVEVKPDDLIIIEGIGPRISGVLKNNGVKTFAQLAAMQPAEIKAILNAVDERLGRIADPSSWPEQAALAARGDLEGLQKLQDSLKGGRIA